MNPRDVLTHVRVPHAILRRDFLEGMGRLMALLVAAGRRPPANASTAETPSFAYVGCFTAKEDGSRGEGIGVYRIERESGRWVPVQLVGGLANPSFLTLDRRGRFLYSADGEGDAAAAFQIDGATGRLTLVNRQSTGGRTGARLVVDPTNRFLIVANYGSGNVAVLPINPDGTLAPPSDLVSLPGAPGPNRARQEGSHPHDTVFDREGRFLVLPDLGLDKVFVYRLDPAAGKLVANDPAFATARPGAGPRHVAFHLSNRYAYVINELDSTITACRFDAARGALTPAQTSPTLPPAFTGDNTTAEVAVAPSGRFLYGSNRGHDSICIFAIDQATGLLAPVGWESTRGRTPRFFALDPSGALLYVANLDSDTIVAFRVDQATGRLAPTEQVVKTGSPSSIVFR